MNKIDQRLSTLDLRLREQIKAERELQGEAPFLEHVHEVFFKAPRKVQFDFLERFETFDETKQGGNDFSHLVQTMKEAIESYNEYRQDKKFEKSYAKVSNELAQEKVSLALKKETIRFRPKYQRPSGMRYRLKRTVRQVFGTNSRLLSLPKSCTEKGDRWDVRPQNGREILLIRVE